MLVGCCHASSIARGRRPVWGLTYLTESPGRDHLACARLLLEVGAAPDPIEVDACGDEELVELLREHVHDIA